MRTFTCRSTFLYDHNHLIFRKKYIETQEISQEGLNMTIVDRLNSGIIGKRTKDWEIIYIEENPKTESTL